MRRSGNTFSEVEFYWMISEPRDVASPMAHDLQRAQFLERKRTFLSQCKSGGRMGDSGIMKWPTSAVYSGPPLGQSELLVWTERELRTGAGVGLESQGGALRADSPGVCFLAGSIIGVARKLGVHRRMVREAVRSALPARRKKTERPHLKIAPAAAFIDEVLAADRKAPRK